MNAEKSLPNMESGKANREGVKNLDEQIKKLQNRKTLEFGHLRKRLKTIVSSRENQTHLPATKANAETLWAKTWSKLEKLAKELGIKVFFSYGKSTDSESVAAREIFFTQDGRAYPVDHFRLQRSNLRELKNPQHLFQEIGERLILNLSLYGVVRARTKAAEDLFQGIFAEHGLRSMEGAYRQKSTGFTPTDHRSRG